MGIAKYVHSVGLMLVAHNVRHSGLAQTLLLSKLDITIPAGLDAVAHLLSANIA